MCVGNVIMKVVFLTVGPRNQIVMGSNHLQFEKLIVSNEMACKCFYDCL